MLQLFTLLTETPTTSDTSYTILQIVSYVLVALMFVSALAAIVLVLLQPCNSTGIDALGGSSETFFGKNKGKSIEARMKKWTIVALVVLAVFAIVFYIIYSFAW